MKNKIWGQTLLIDLSGCEYNLLTNPQKLREFNNKLCKEIRMVSYGKPIIKRFGQGNLEGYSSMQFIETSTITVHLDEFGLRAFIDIFTCKRFSVNKAKNFCKSFFKAKKIRYRNFYRH
ncbi:MAG: S-adenosylmethionine decarboxylase family protein [Patescibacteria group bacterium]